MTDSMVSFMVFSPVTGIRTLTENQSFLSSLSPMLYFSIPPLSYPKHDFTANMHSFTVYSVLTVTDTLQCCGDIKHRNIHKGIYPVLSACVLRSFQESAHVANILVH